MKWFATWRRNLLWKFTDFLILHYGLTPPSRTIGGETDPYLYRWFLIPRNRFFNVYLHQFLRDDDDRALHDHPWFWCSILLSGSYTEISQSGIKRRQEGSIRFSSPWRLHRVVLDKRKQGEWLISPVGTPKPVWTLFITGPVIRNWGFMCPERRWVPWQEFTAPDNPDIVGKGCEP